MAGTYTVTQKDNDFLPRVKQVWRPFINDQDLDYELQMEQIRPKEGNQLQ
jgi:hypothetical protein